MKKRLITNVFKKEEMIWLRNTEETVDSPAEWAVTNARIIIKNPAPSIQETIMDALGFSNVIGDYSKINKTIEGKAFPNYSEIIPKPDTDRFPCYKFRDTELYYKNSIDAYIKILELINKQYAYINKNYYELISQLTSERNILISKNREMAVGTFDDATIDKSNRYIIMMLMRPGIFDKELERYLIDLRSKLI